MNTPASRRSFGRLFQLLVVPFCVTVVASAAPNQTSGSPDAINGLPAYHARFERPRPVVTIIGEDVGTDLSDFVIPYGVLNLPDVAEVITVSTQPGVPRLRPVLKVQADASIALAVMADGYSRTGRSMLHALAASPEPVRSRSGLMILPGTLAGGQRMDLHLPDLVDSPFAQAFNTVLDSIDRLYGHNTAYGTGLIFEYPMMPQRHFVRAAGGR